MKKPVLLLTALLFFSNYLFAQNSMVGDGFGGRGWYKSHNYQVGAYSAYTVCGDSNQLYGWGAGYNGALGNGTTISSDTPVKVTGMTNTSFFTTGYVSAVIKKDSSVWVWGTNQYSSSGFSYVPRRALGNVKFVDGGFDHIVFVKYDGTVWGAGKNTDGQLGNGTIFSYATPFPVQMQGITNAVRAVALMSGINGATAILLADSTVMITGGGGGFYTYQTQPRTIPVKIEGLKNIIDIKGNVALYALNSSGEVFATGRGNLGYPNINGDVQPPIKINFPAGAASIVALSVNNDGGYCFALDSNHAVYAWGDSGYGQLGDGSDSFHRDIPVLVATDVIDIFAGENFSYLLKADGTLWATGKSGYDFNPGTWGSIWMNLPNIQRNVFTRIDPAIPPMNLCAPKIWGVLPVKLSNFNCIANNNNAILNWQSAEETNAGKYIVEYSSDGRNFQSIATVVAKGSNNKYSFIHQQVNGTAFYRLTMMDKDGKFIYSEIRTIKFDTKNSFTIAPNPANDIIHIYTKSNNDIKSVQVFSVEGKLLQSIHVYQSGEGINVSKLSRGTYSVKVILKNESAEYGRFIKM